MWQFWPHAQRRKTSQTSHGSGTTGVMWLILALNMTKSKKSSKFPLLISLKKLFHINLLKFWTEKLCFKEQKRFIQIITIWGTSTFFSNYWRFLKKTQYHKVLLLTYCLQRVHTNRRMITADQSKGLSDSVCSPWECQFFI